MPSKSKFNDPNYRRGEFWLDYDRGRNGKPRSPNLYIFWYDPERRRTRNASTGTSEIAAARLELDRRYEEKHGAHASYCVTCGRPLADAAQVTVADAIGYYWSDVGAKRSSADSINARLKHVLDWLDATGRPNLTCADFNDAEAEKFRDWMKKQPIIIRKKDGTIAKIKVRSPATVEESLHSLKAAFKYLEESKKLIDHAPKFATFQRDAVSQKNKTRLSLDEIARMLAYAAEPNKKRQALHAFLVAAVTTAARPDAIFDISVKPERGQWVPGTYELSLNPRGRVQTKKHRPDVWTPPQLVDWLEATAADPRANGWLVNYDGGPVKDVDSAWDTMIAKLGLPIAPEYKSYVIRRSIATILKNWHRNHENGTVVDYRELQEQMGHAKKTVTDDYALVSPEPTSTVSKAICEMLAEIERIAPGAFHRNCTGKTREEVSQAA